jgi:hypothetical protein
MQRRQLLLASLSAFPLAALTKASAEEKPKITHSFLALGADTRLISGEGKVLWSYPKPTRDGWVLPNGNILLAIGGKPGGIVELTRENQVVFEWTGTQDEVDTAQRLRDGNTMTTEAGPKPRLLELNPKGEIVKELALSSQRDNTHMQQRMSRRLRNGNYLVPHLWDRVVKEYTPDGKVVWEVKTPNMPFTAIRLRDGNTVIGCTWGNMVIEVDLKGAIVWQADNDNVPGKLFDDCCGVQRLPNGNTVITSYRSAPNKVKLTEITREREVVWTYTDDRPNGIHHFQILDTNGKALEGRPLK